MKTPDILLSVVIPTFNYGHMLRRSVESVLAQLTEHSELVVVDDGSTDDTPALLDALAAGRPGGFRWLRQDNGGAAAARNRGLGASLGRFIFFLDSDDELLPGALAALCAAIRAHPEATVLVGGRLSAWPDGREKAHAPPHGLSADPCKRVADYLLRKSISISHGSVAAHRGLIERRPYPEALRGREDLPVMAYWLAWGRIVCIEATLGRKHKHADSLRHTVKVSEPLELALADEIFRGLPEPCQRLKPSYLGQRYLALSRAALDAGDRARAGRHLRAALRADAGQLLGRGQLRKLIRSWLGVRRRRAA